MLKKFLLALALACLVGWALTQPTGGAFLRYTAQVLTGAQQAQVRTNLGLGSVYAALGNIPSSVVSSDVTLAASLRGTVVRCDASGGARVLTLPTSPNADDILTIVKSDSTTNRCTVRVAGADVAWLSTTHDFVTWQFTGGWTPRQVVIAEEMQVFTSSSSWIRRPLLKEIDLYKCGGGGGGGSGRVSATGVAAFGGGAGGHGQMNKWTIHATELPAANTSINVTIAAGGNGGAAQTTASTNGLVGSNGGETFFGTAGQAWHVGAGPGTGGAGGTNAAGTAGTPRIGTWVTQGNLSNNTSLTVPSTPITMISVAGHGGSVNTSNVATAGNISNNGWTGGLNSNATIATAGVTPSAYTITPTSVIRQPAASGGSAATTTNGFAGGDADNAPCTGGGGGGAARDTFSSGRGGRGGPGLVIVVSKY